MFGRKHEGAADSFVRQMGTKNGNLKAPPAKKQAPAKAMQKKGK